MKSKNLILNTKKVRENQNVASSKLPRIWSNFAKNKDQLLSLVY